MKQQLDDFKETWDGFNTSQKNSFVKAYKDEIGEILQAVEEELEFEQQEEEEVIAQK